MSAPARLLVVNADQQLPRLAEVAFTELERSLRRGDVLVVNDAATLPASLHGRAEDGAQIELRLLGASDADERFRAVLMGAGDFHTRTEFRPAPPLIQPGAQLLFPGLRARVASISEISPRLLDVVFDAHGEALWAALYRAGRPVQYAHHQDALPLYAVQTVYAGRPWAAEMPSAGWPLRWSLLLELRRKGVALACLTHAAGLSATGDPAIDAALPLPERFEIPLATVQAIARARAASGRVIAVGTTVVRALEGCVRQYGELRAGGGVTDLVIDPGFVPRVVDGLLTGMHDPSESHFRLLQAFAPARELLDALAYAGAHGFRDHEFGDSMLLLRHPQQLAQPICSAR